MRTCLALTLLLVVTTAAPVSAADWSTTINRVAPSIVSIHVDATRPFDTEANMSAEATGFVVDAKRGLILTNRHVVQPGPVVAEAVFGDREEVELHPVYRDPVHDFGFYRYDPKALKFSHPKSISLDPSHATVGREIRVIGNDAGEQLSILAGTLARLDRDAPDYGRGGYNDFNTFYLQAASGTSGGSSGSPVLDIQGNAIGLNAGGSNGASTSFFLPLDRVVRALHRIQQGKPVTRGTLETTFVYKPYDELRRLGLRDSTEAAARKAHPNRTGMLVVDQVLPGGPADGQLKPGDILVSVNGEPVQSFVPLETVLDSDVGDTVKLTLERGGKPLHVKLPVADLHSITPSRYVDISGAVLHTLSYQMARALNMPTRGVFVASPGYMLSVAGIPRGAVLTRFNGRPLTDVGELREALGKLGDNATARVHFFTFDQPNRSQVAVVRIDRRWFPARACQRSDATGLWPCQPLAEAAPAGPPDPVNVDFADYDDPRAQRLARSLVFVNFDMPYPIDGVDAAHYFGTGVVIDADKGLVVVDRNTVPVTMGDVRLTFAGSVQIPAKVVYLHPLHNLAVLKYDPKLLGDTPVKNAPLVSRTAEVGQDVWLVGIRPDQTLAVQASEVSDKLPANFPLSHTFRFRDSNITLTNISGAPDDINGVLTDKDGNVLSLWASFAFDSSGGLQQQSYGISADQLIELRNIVENPGHELRSLEAEFSRMPLSQARQYGLPDAWVKKLGALDPRERKALVIDRLVADTSAEAQLQPGDIVLAIDGQPINEFRAVEKATQKPQVNVTVFRGGKVLELPVKTAALSGRNTERAVVWAGALLQAPHRAVAAQRGISRTGVFVAYYAYGSPASHYGLSPGRRIVAVDGQPTPDLDAFLAQVRSKQDRDAVRLTTVNWDGRTEVITLKLDLNYFPTYQLELTGDGWKREDLRHQD